MTAQSLRAEFDGAGRISGRVLASVLADKQYVLSLSEEEAADLIYIAAFAYFDNRREEEMLLNMLTKELDSAYDQAEPEFTLKYFYAMTVASLGHNPGLYRDVQNWAFGKVQAAYEGTDDGRAGAWPALVLFFLAQAAEAEDWPFVMDDNQRWAFEQRLENTVRGFDRLKDLPTDYMLSGVKSGKVWSATNQGALISLFAQINSFFAMEEGANMARQMASTGGFNDLGRTAIKGVSNTANPTRFNAKKETFYLHVPVPGSDGMGNFVDSPNGRKHQILSLLMQALFSSYNTLPKQESSVKMQAFIQAYLRTDSEGHFMYYLYIPLQGMRLGAKMHENNFLDGWEPQEAALQAQLYAALKQGYRWKVACTAVQGSCEVAAEWMAIGKLIGGVFKGLGWVGRGAGRAAKAGGNQLVNALPARALVPLALLEVGSRQAGKTVMLWSRSGINTMLKYVGWREAATAGAVALVSDAPVN